MAGCGRELEQAWRGMLRHRGFAGAVVLFLGLGFTFASAVFAIVDPLLWRPLPFDDPDRLVLIRAAPGSLVTPHRSAGPTLEYWRTRVDLFEAVSGFGDRQTLTVRSPDGVRRLRVVAVLPDLLRVLFPSGSISLPLSSALGDGALVLLGRSAHAPVLLEAAWLTEAGDTGRMFGVVGPLPDSFTFPSSPRVSPPDALLLASAMRVEESPNRVQVMTVVGRLRPTATAEHVLAAIGRAFPDAENSLDVQPLSAFMAGPHGRTAFAAFAASLLVMLASVSSLLNILAARIWFRRAEFTTRVALGASRAHLVRLTLTELGLVTLMSLAVALPAVVVLLQVIAGLIPREYAPVGPPDLTLRVVVFLLTLGAVVLVAAGVASVLAVLRVVSAGLDSPTAASDARWVRIAAAACQSAVAMIVITGGVLLGRSYFNLWMQDTGASHETLLVSVSYPPAPSAERFLEQVEETIRALGGTPGVLAVGAGTGGLLNNLMTAGGAAFRVPGGNLIVPVKEVSATYFDALGSRLLAGNAGGAGETGRSALIINESMLRRAWPEGSPSDAVGRIVLMGRNGEAAEIVGIVQDVYDYALDVRPAPVAYRPIRQPTAGPMHYVLRTAGGFEDVLARRVVTRINPDAAVLEVGSIGDRLAQSVADRTFSTLIMILFACAGLSVCAAGLSSIVSFVVARRTREIAIRLAIGAPPSHIRWVVTRDSMGALVAGIAAGGLSAWWLFQGVRSQLYEVRPDEPMVWLAAAALLVATGFGVVWPIVGRATRLSPIEALRTE